MAEEAQGRRRWWRQGPDLLVRVLAAFALVNVLVGVVAPRLDGNWLWLGVPAWPGWLRTGLLLAFGAGVLAFDRLGPCGRRAAQFVAALAAAGCLWDAGAFYRLLLTGRLAAALPVPLSLPLAATLALWAARPSARPPVRTWGRRAHRVVLAGMVTAALLTVQLFAFGTTDYRRRADAIVVFGARAYPDGTCSQALRDRTRTAVELHRQGLADVLVFSGGRDAGSRLSEPEAMRELAVSLGVPAEAIVLDEQGVNSAATVAHAAHLAGRHGWRSVLMVSHDYHLSRIKLLCHRQGLRAYTVPAREQRGLRRKPAYVVRELAAWAFHYVRPAAG